MPDSQLTPLRKLRIALGLTGPEVAEGAGISQSAYTKVELGDYTASPDVAARLVEFFGPPLTEEHILFHQRFPRFLEHGITSSDAVNRDVSEIPLQSLSGRGRRAT